MNDGKAASLIPVHPVERGEYVSVPDVSPVSDHQWDQDLPAVVDRDHTIHLERSKACCQSYAIGRAVFLSFRSHTIIHILLPQVREAVNDPVAPLFPPNEISFPHDREMVGEL